MQASGRIPFVVVVSLVLTATASVGAQDHASPTLPLKRVRLYETGVAYFERSGTMLGTAGVSLPVPAGHLDDALKTLVVLGASDKTQVSAVEFPSGLSRDMARAMAGLSSSQEEGEEISYQRLLATLKGAQVDVKTRGGAFTGRLVDVVTPPPGEAQTCVVTESPPVHDGNPQAVGRRCAPEQQTTLVLLTDRNELVRARIGDLLSVRPMDPAVATRLRSGLDAASARASQIRRNLAVMASGQTPVTLGYIAEAPIWRSTYRIVLDRSAERATLQGWALLHNDTDEDWKRVRMELVNGQPDSFLFPLAAPRYARRPLHTPSVELSTVPQLQDTTVDNMWRGDVGDSYGVGGLGLSGVGEGGGGTGEGIGLGRIGTIGHGAGVGAGSTSSSSALGVGDLAATGQVESMESAALFQYALQTPVDLRAHGSALVPFVHESVKARRLAWIRAPGEVARAGIHLVNDTKQTLPAGPLSVFADSGFAGESAIERLKPSESRIIAFGTDPDIEISIVQQTRTDATKLLQFKQDQVQEHFVRRHAIDYDLVNRSGVGRTVYLGLDFVRNTKVKGADGLEFDTERNRAIAVFNLAPQSRSQRHVDADEGLVRARPLKELPARILREMAAAQSLPATQKAILLEAAQLLTEADQRQAGASARELEVEDTLRELERSRVTVQDVSRILPSSAEDLATRILEMNERITKLSKEARSLRADATVRKQRAREVLVRLTDQKEVAKGR